MVLKLLISFLFSFQTVLSHPKIVEISDLGTLEALNSKNTMASVESEKDKLIYFWATWCDVCKTKLTSVFKEDSLYKKFDVYLVATDQDKAKVEHFQNKFKLKSFVVLDPQRKIQEKFQIYGVPTLVRLQPEAGKLTVRAFQAGGEIEKLLQ